MTYDNINTHHERIRFHPIFSNQRGAVRLQSHLGSEFIQQAQKLVDMYHRKQEPFNSVTNSGASQPAIHAQYAHLIDCARAVNTGEDLVFEIERLLEFCGVKIKDVKPSNNKINIMRGSIF